MVCTSGKKRIVQIDRRSRFTMDLRTRMETFIWAIWSIKYAKLTFITFIRRFLTLSLYQKVLKDIYLRYKLISGYKVNYIPGWDCHGLPIELNALKSLKAKEKKSSKKQVQVDELSLNKKDPFKIRAFSRDYALECIQIQMNSFKRMNLLADWSQIYRTIDPDFLCNELDLFYKLYEKNLIYRAYMPVYWSVSSQTALAESELEYNSEHKSDALYVAFKLVNYSDEIKKHLSKKTLLQFIYLVKSRLKFVFIC
jgi:isoleucyl-tRNA synthetase